MSYTILGAGAIGGVLGAALAEAGRNVVFVEANPEHRAAIAANGLQISGWRSYACRAPVIAPEETGRELNTVLLAVKSLATEQAIADLTGRLAPDGVVVSLQNGLNEYALAEAFGSERVIGAYLTFGGFVDGPGRIRYAGEGSFRIGELDGAETARVRDLAEVFSTLQPCSVTDNIFGYLWAKMVLGAVYYATALLDRDVPDIYARPEALEMLGRAAREAALVARANGVRLEDVDGFHPDAYADDDPDGIAASWEAQRAYWGAHVGNARTGIWRDLAVHRRQTECRAHVGSVIARRGDLQTPTLDRIARMVGEVETGTASLGWHNLSEL